MRGLLWIQINQLRSQQNIRVFTQAKFISSWLVAWISWKCAQKQLVTNVSTQWRLTSCMRGLTLNSDKSVDKSLVSKIYKSFNNPNIFHPDCLFLNIRMKTWKKNKLGNVQGRSVLGQLPYWLPCINFLDRLITRMITDVMQLQAPAEITICYPNAIGEGMLHYKKCHELCLL